MGLGLSVGFLKDMRENDDEGYDYFKRTLVKVNEALATVGLPTHIEPEDLSPTDEVSSAMFGYSGLHYLRRIAAHITYNGKIPSPGNDKASKDPLLEKYYQESIAPAPAGLSKWFSRPRKFMFNHLILHSDAEGYYLPADFEDVIFPDGALKIPGAMIGSSRRLLAECQSLAKALHLPTDIDPESEELWEAADEQGKGEGWRAYGVESFTCIRLIRACEASLRSGAAIVFC